MFIVYIFPLTPTASHAKTKFHALPSVTLLYFGMFKIFFESLSDLYLLIHYIYFTIRHSDLIKKVFLFCTHVALYSIRNESSFLS
jgi:uncharacterized protein YqhQ